MSTLIANHENQLIEDIYQQGFHIIDNFLPSHHCQSLRSTAETLRSQGQFRSAKIGRNQHATHNSSVRTDQICWVDKQNNAAINAYMMRITEIKTLLNQSLFLGLVDFETHFAIYEPGAFYKKHIDQFATTKDRRISCVYYLNETWDESFAGQLTLFDRNDNYLSSINPLGNRFICFSSDLPHEVCQTQKTRYSLTGWIKTRPLT
ncbi:2OG-Fe(II) oxygenase [Legionella cardiaca]|uniref:2OG-Fe(II) oxygenase n=1 Tax=Legionella cardiaca TaxID=1071983 RepID=A0ABY8ARZ1_9GAMM|nr:2OG-Fe(II) oxygenase [Legionella cardiaca]WED42534.1 2OG-Fe(II) oxygenase [Legionella cardiaca]